MNGKTHKRRRLSVIALAASVAAIAIPAATAGGKHEAFRVLGPGLNTVQKQGPYGGYWIRKQEATRVLGPGLNTVEKRGPYGAYWVSKPAQENEKFTPSVVDRLVGSPDPRDTADQGLNEPSMNEVHLYPGELADVTSRSDDVSSQVFRNAGQEHGSNGFLGQTTNQDHVNVMFPRADDKLFREIIKDAALEHGAAGFGNTTQAVRVLKAAPSVLAPDYSHLPGGDRPSGTAYGA
jgi:hypothetical protein